MIAWDISSIHTHCQLLEIVSIFLFIFGCFWVPSELRSSGFSRFLHPTFFFGNGWGGVIIFKLTEYSYCVLFVISCACMHTFWFLSLIIYKAAVKVRNEFINTTGISSGQKGENKSMGSDWGIQEPPSSVLAFIWGSQTGEETSEIWGSAQVKIHCDISLSFDPKCNWT